MNHCFTVDRRPSESPKACQAVRIYLEMGPDRSQRPVATQLAKQKSQIQNGQRGGSGWLAPLFSMNTALAKNNAP